MTASALHVAIQGGNQWVVTDGGSTTIPIGGNHVTLDGITYLLVDQFSGGFQHVQDAINAATGAATILIAPGTAGAAYVESAIPTEATGTAGGLYINKPNLTLQGVDAAGNPITSASGAQGSGPVIVSGQETDFGSNHFVGVNGDGTVIQGVHLQAGPETTDKVLEIWADDVTVENSFVDANANPATYTASNAFFDPLTGYTGAVAIYLNDNGTTASDEITSYTITGNILNEGIVIANGVGDPTGHAISGTQIITDNEFVGTFDDDTGLGRYDTVVINGEVNGIPWLLEPTQTPTIAGNTLDNNSAPLILRGSDNDVANLPTAAQIQTILDSTGLTVGGNDDLHYAYVVDSNGELVTAERLAFDAFTGDPVLDEHGVQLTYHSFAVTNSIDTLNLSLDATPDAVFGGQRDYIHSGNTIIVQSGDTDSVDSQIMVDNLTIKATAHSSDLDLTLATLYADGSAIPGGVHDVTLADYDGPGHHGANVDVTGNGLANHIVGNSGANTLDGAGGNDTLEGGRGNDSLVGGSGTDTAVYDATLTLDDISYDNGTHTWTVNAGVEGSDTLEGIETVDHAGGHILLVGGGGYATIQAAVDAAQAGDTIMVGAGTFVGATIGKELTIIGSGSGQTIIDATTAANGFSLTGDIDATSAGSATVTIKGFGFTDNNIGIRVASGVNLDHLVIQNSDFTQNKTSGVGMGSGAFGLSQIEISDSTFTRNGDGSFNGDGDISLFGFTGDALLKNLTITGGTNAVPTNANADIAIQINGRDPVNYDVTHPIGSVVFDNVDVTGSYAKVLLYVQGYTNLNGLSFLDTGSSFSGHAGWGYAVNIDPTADETSLATPGVAGEPGFFDDTAAGALAPSSLDLSHVTISNDIPVNVGSGHPLFGVNGQALGAVFSGTPVSDHAIGSEAKEVMIGRAGADDLDGRGGNDVLNGGAGNDQLKGGAGSDTAVYSDPLDAGALTYDFSNSRWQVVTATEGTDQVSGIGQLAHGGAGRFFLVSGDSDFATTNSVAASTVTGDATFTALSVVEGSTVVDDFSGFGVSASSLGGADAGLFHVDGTGHLLFNAAPDFETPADAGLDNVYRVQFQTATGKTVTHTYEIRVTNASISSVADANAATNQVSEAAANGATVGITAQGSDGAGVAGVTYSLSNNPNGAFAINASGVVTVLDHTKLDFETLQQMTITVLASDGNVAHDISQLFTINVANVIGHTVNGSNQADAINGTHGPTGPQAVSGFATQEEDTIRGKAGNDTIRGLGGNDRLFGDAGNDRLFGDNAKDRLDGGVGTDSLTGGANVDTFVFKRGYGHDTVLDYVAGTDKIDLSGTGAHGFGGIHLVKSGANVDIHVGSDILTLAHTTIATINAHHSDFIFA